MESDNGSNGAVKPPPLSSDQLNYLIWRYLQEAGYGEAAVKLQRDWKVEPEKLPFAQHIKGPALVSLVQKGLRYHHLMLTVDEQGQSSKALEPSMFFFGPEGARLDMAQTREPLIRPNEMQRSSSPASTSMTIPKKREPDSNGMAESANQSTKRSRKTTQVGMERNGVNARKPSSTISTTEMPNAMDIDSVNGSAAHVRNMRSPSAGEVLHDESVTNGNNLDVRMDVDMDATTPSANGPEPMIHEQLDETILPLVHTRTHGESVGIQVDPAKVANLGPSTSILSVTGGSHVTKISWRPGDHSTLTATGHNFCNVWRLAGANLREDAVKPEPETVEVTANGTKTVTASSWQPNGDVLAVATYASQGGLLHTFDGDELTLSEELPASRKLVTSLKWLVPGQRIVGIMPHDEQTPGQAESSSINQWVVGTFGAQLTSAPASLAVPELLVDIDTTQGTGDGMICAVGGNAVYLCRADPELTIERKWTSAVEDGDSWSFVKCSWRPNNDTMIIAASANTARIWFPTKDVIESNAHDAPITGLELRPRNYQTMDASSPIEFATSSVDGSMKVWHYDPYTNAIQSIHTLSIEQTSPIMTMSYSPDGFCLAGASFGNVHIFNAEHGYNLMASWNASDREWQGTTMKEEDVMSYSGRSSINGENGLSGAADHTLAWDDDSKKLAFGLASQIAVINFQR